MENNQNLLSGSVRLMMTGKSFPDDLQDVMGYALHLAQCGEKAANAKPLSGFKGASVLEITDDYGGDTYRAVYTVKFRALFMFCMYSRRKAKKVLPHQKVIFS